MGRRPKCKTCVDYQPQADGTVICGYNGRLIDAESSPLFDDGQCYERKERRKLTPEELFAARSAAGRKGGSKKGGRKQKRQVQLDKIDYEVFSRYAVGIRKTTLVSVFHFIAGQLAKKHPELKPPEWID